jgi:hypothetical protein
VSSYRPPARPAFKFPFRIGARSLATGSLNAPGTGKKMPPIKQFSAMKPGRPKPKVK